MEGEVGKAGCRERMEEGGKNGIRGEYTDVALQFDDAVEDFHSPHLAGQGQRGQVLVVEDLKIGWSKRVLYSVRKQFLNR